MSDRNRSLNSLEDIEFAVKRIEELEAKLAMAVEAFETIEDASKFYASDRQTDYETLKYAHETTRRLCSTTLAELKGQPNDH